MSEQKFRLLVQRGPEPGKEYELSSVSITIGRDPMSEITITDPEVSRQHVRLTGTLTGYSIQDLGSTNGTYVDGKRLGGEPIDLIVGQVITMGTGVALQFQAYSEGGAEMATMLDGASVATMVTPEEDGVVDGALDLPQPDQGIKDEAPMAGDDELDLEEAQEPERITEYDQVDDMVPLTHDTDPVQDSEPLEDEQPESVDYEEPQVEAPSEFAADPVIIPHHGDPDPSELEDEQSQWRTPAIVVSLLLVVICCCCGFFLFIYYYGGDWMLRQMGLLP